jgi:hypothetical protein
VIRALAAAVPRAALAAVDRRPMVPAACWRRRMTAPVTARAPTGARALATVPFSSPATQASPSTIRQPLPRAARA